MQYTKLNIGNKIINLSNHVYSTPHRDAAKNMTFEKPQKSTAAQKALINRDILLIYRILYIKMRR